MGKKLPQETISIIFIVAEIGVNWNGIAHACRMIIAAKEAGADAVKFQCFKEEHIKGHPRFEELRRMILDLESLKILKECADYNKIEFFATPFYPEAVDMLEEIGVKRYKVRERDNHNTELIKKVADTNKPYYVSSEKGIYPRAYLPECGNLIYCVPKYPASLKDIQMPQYMNAEFVGYSNHYPGVTPALLAVARGTQYIEIHVMDQNHKYDFGAAEPIDQNVSWSFKQLAEFIQLAREMEVIL